MKDRYPGEENAGELRPHPRHPIPPQLWAASLIVMGGLALIGLGGCFLVGVMMLLVGDFFWGPSLVDWTPATYLLLGMLFVLATACFVVAAVIVPAGFRGLFRLMRGR